MTTTFHLAEGNKCWRSMLAALDDLERALNLLESRDRARQAARTAGPGVMPLVGSENASSARRNGRNWP